MVHPTQAIAGEAFVVLSGWTAVAAYFATLEWTAVGSVSLALCLVVHFGGHVAATDGVGMASGTGLPLSTTAMLALGELSVAVLAVAIYLSLAQLRHEPHI